MNDLTYCMDEGFAKMTELIELKVPLLSIAKIEFFKFHIGQTQQNTRRTKN